MNKKKQVIINHTNTVFKDFFNVDEAFIQIKRFNGNISKEFRRISVIRSDTSCVLLFDKNIDSILLVNQFRYSSHTKGDSFMYEIPAGILEKDEKPVDTIIRETFEETGYEIKKPSLVYCFYPSSGVSSERCFLYYSEISLEEKKSAGGGLIEESEDIQTTWFTLNELKNLLSKGKIIDAKTIIALQWFFLSRLS